MFDCRRIPHLTSGWFLFFVGAALAGCGRAEFNCKTESGRAAIVTAVDSALNTQDCATAVTTIEPYATDAACGTDEIRFARASAYACAANVNFFRLVSELGTADLGSSAIVQSITKLFPSTAQDAKVIAAEYALDALFSIRIPGAITPPQYLVNASSANPITLIPSHRKADANVFGIFTSMALMGALQSRYGNPNGAYERTQNIGATSGNPSGWESPAAITEDACAYAAATLTFIDTIGEAGSLLGAKFGGSLGTELAGMATYFSSAFDTQCAAECSACGLTCTGCPITLRHRGSCAVAPATPNVESCAASGIMKVINLGWPSG